jgi:prepilin-type processing-associated H-X9-DG protein
MNPGGLTYYHPVVFRGPFIIATKIRVGTKATEITDGLSKTFAMGEAAGGNDRYRLRSTPTLFADQAWAVPVFRNPNFRVDTGSNIAVVANVRFNSVFPLTTASVRRIDPEPLNRTDGITASTDDPGAADIDSLNGFRSMHPGGGLFLFLDGHLEFVSESVAANVYQAAGTIAGGETAGPVNP